MGTKIFEYLCAHTTHTTRCYTFDAVVILLFRCFTLLFRNNYLKDRIRYSCWKKDLYSLFLSYYAYYSRSRSRLCDGLRVKFWNLNCEWLTRCLLTLRSLFFPLIFPHTLIPLVVKSSKYLIGQIHVWLILKFVPHKQLAFIIGGTRIYAQNVIIA